MKYERTNFMLKINDKNVDCISKKEITVIKSIVMSLSLAILFKLVTILSITRLSVNPFSLFSISLPYQTIFICTHYSMTWNNYTPPAPPTAYNDISLYSFFFLTFFYITISNNTTI